MDHNMVFSYNYSSRNRRRRRTNVLRRGPFRWPWRCADEIRSASPEAACPGLHQKPLNAAIGRLLAPYRPIGCQGDNQLNDDATCTHFVGRFDGHCYAAVLYLAHHPMEEVRGFH